LRCNGRRTVRWRKCYTCGRIQFLARPRRGNDSDV
jgi:hypothetical protein